MRPSSENLTRVAPVAGAGDAVGAVTGACVLPEFCAMAGTAEAMAKASRWLGRKSRMN